MSEDLMAREAKKEHLKRRRNPFPPGLCAHNEDGWSILNNSTGAVVYVAKTQDHLVVVVEDAPKKRRKRKG